MNFFFGCKKNATEIRMQKSSFLARMCKKKDIVLLVVIFKRNLFEAVAMQGFFCALSRNWSILAFTIEVYSLTKRIVSTYLSNITVYSNVVMSFSPFRK